ncbi:methylmalonyl-CoA epimerase [Oceanithermus sp.]
MELHHVGVAVLDLAEAAERYRALGYQLIAEEILPEQGVHAAMLQSGASRIELLEPLGPETTVGRFLEKRGPGLHHLAFATPNLIEQLERLRAEGVRLIDEAPRRGFGGHWVAFAHPKSYGGVLVEFVEEPQ